MTTVADLEHEGDQSLDEVLRANQDLAVRLRELDPDIFYDREGDTFMVTLGEPQEALTESLAGGHLYIRVDPDTLKIVGIEILDLSARLADDPAVKRVWLAARNLAGPCNAADVPETVTDASERLTDALRQLAAA